MAEKSPLKTVLKTSLPAVIDLSSQTFMWTIEAIMIGKISAAAFGGVGMAVQMIIVVLTVLLTFIVGSAVIINRYLGAKDYWEANHILGQALMVGINSDFEVRWALALSGDINTSAMRGTLFRIANDAHSLIEFDLDVNWQF